MSSRPNLKQSPIGNMKTLFFVEFFFLVIIGNELATIVTAITITGNKDEAELISLYDENDSVVELLASNISTVYNPNKVWFVEFYAHWCGHCQRFSPIWKQLAAEFDVPNWA